MIGGFVAFDEFPIAATDSGVRAGIAGMIVGEVPEQASLVF